MRTCCVLTVLAALAGAQAVPAADEEPPAGTKVVEVRVRGNSQTATNVILERVRTRVGQPYSREVVQDDQKRLQATGRFDSVVAEVAPAPAQAGTIVTFVVAERALLTKVTFVGNKKFKAEDLAKELTFGAGDPLNRYSIELGRQAIEAKYKAKGYHFAEVQVDAGVLELSREVIYRIVEGPQVIITKVSYVGREAFGTLRLGQHVRTSARLWPLRPGYLDVEQVDRDAHAIRQLYVSEGYLDAEVGRELKFVKDRQRVHVIFRIKEGCRYRLNRVVFTGNKVFSDEELAKRLSMQQGDFVTTLTLTRDTKALESTYGELGYIEARAEVRKQRLDPDKPPPAWARELDGGRPALLNLLVDITEADAFTVGMIDIRGNEHTQERVIRRELRIFPEKLYNTVAVAESRKRLQETWLFEKVGIEPMGTAKGVRDVLVEVTERRTGQFLIGVGVSTSSGVLGNIEFTQRNFDILAWPQSWRDFFRAKAFKGAGQMFRIAAEPGTELMRFQVSWTEPYLFDRPYSLSSKVFLFQRGRETYDEIRYGGVVSFGHRFKNRWYGELSARVEGVDITDLDADAPREVRQDEGTHLLAGIKGTLVRDRTDSRWMPSTGDRLSFSYEQVVGDYQFGSAAAAYRIYRTVYVDSLDRKHIIAGRGTVGFLQGDTPIFERFYGGGLGSVRGFRYRGISPRSVDNGDPIGGEFLAFLGTEYSFPLLSDKVRGVVFLDSGTVTEDVSLSPYRVSAGFGFRWIVPLLGPIPISIDFGFPIRQDAEDDTRMVQFSLGWSFH